MGTINIAGPQDIWILVISDATVATTNPYRPASATMLQTILMDGYTGVLVRAKYLAAATLTTDPVIAVFGLRKTLNGTAYGILLDSDGSRTSTLSDTSSDVSDGTSNWTDSTLKIDALGSYSVMITIPTAAVASSGAVSIEATRY